MKPTVVAPDHVQIRGGNLSHKESGRRATIADERVVVGRGLSSHFQVEDARVSTAHCELVATARGVMLRDLASKNGTRVGDVELGPEQHVFLRRACAIRIGGTVLEFAPRPSKERELASSLGAFESRSPAMQQVLAQVLRIAATRTTVHLTGPSGTGKGWVARALHDRSPRASKPFVVIDCSVIPPSLAEAYLFGHEKGAYTGAHRSKESPFVDADGGTVFLDEVGDLPVEVQAKLLRVVDEREVQSVGQNRYRKVDVRILSATKRDLAAGVNAGTFREDLYYRLTATRIALPALSERPEDVEPLARQILIDLGRPDAFEAIEPQTMAWMTKNPWPGNVRRLRQVLQLAVELWQDGPLDVRGAHALSGPAGGAAREAALGTEDSMYEALTALGTDHKAVMLAADRILLGRLVRETGGNLAEMRRRTNVSLPWLRERLRELALREIPASTKDRVRGGPMRNDPESAVRDRAERARPLVGVGRAGNKAHRSF